MIGKVGVENIRAIVRMLATITAGAVQKKPARWFIGQWRVLWDAVRGLKHVPEEAADADPDEIQSLAITAAQTLAQHGVVSGKVEEAVRFIVSGALLLARGIWILTEKNEQEEQQ